MAVAEKKKEWGAEMDYPSDEELPELPTRHETEVDVNGVKTVTTYRTDETGAIKGPTVVAADAVGAGVGELVLYAAGSSARQTAVTKNRPVDHVIMAIVDTIHDGGKLAYDKAAVS